MPPNPLHGGWGSGYGPHNTSRGAVFWEFHLLYGRPVTLFMVPGLSRGQATRQARFEGWACRFRV